MEIIEFKICTFFGFQFRVPLYAQKDLDTAVELIDANCRTSSLRVFLIKSYDAPSSPMGPPPGRLRNLFERPPVNLLKRKFGIL